MRCAANCNQSPQSPRIPHFLGTPKGVPFLSHVSQPDTQKNRTRRHASSTVFCTHHFISMAFLGHAPAQIPQPTHFSASSFQVLAARSTVMASCGHFFAHSVQYTHLSASAAGLPPPAAGAACAAGFVKVSVFFCTSGAVYPFFHVQALFRAGQHAASALHAVKPRDLPGPRLAVDLDRPGGTGTHAQATADTVLDPNGNVPAHPFRVVGRLERILDCGRLVKQVFEHPAGKGKHSRLIHDFHSIPPLTARYS